MGLNKSKGNMYSWVTHTWNTVKGECPHKCSYCYMHKWGKQKPVRLDEKEFQTHLGAGNVIFVGSSCDLFAKDIPDGWIYDTIGHTTDFPNTYLFQSKNPERMLRYHALMKQTDRVCTTIETNRWYPEIMGNTPKPIDRVMKFAQFKFNRYVTIEPIMDFDLYEMVELIKNCNPVQVNIGADSCENNLPEPKGDKVLNLIYELEKFTQIDQKRNLNRLLSQ
jgi:DNA repair photolyase